MNPWSAPIKQVWFDLDNTLLGSSKILTYSLFTYHYLRLMGPIIGFVPAIKLLRSMRQAVEISGSNENRNNYERSLQVFKQKILPADAEREYHDLLLQIFTKMRPGFFPIPAAAAMLNSQTLQQRSLVLATNPVWPLDIVKLRLDWASIPPEQFQFITNGENMRHSKKTTSYYSDLLQKTQADPGTTLHIGDSPRKDGHAARLGLRVFIVTSRYKKMWRRWQIRKMHLPQQLIRVGTLDELKTFVEGLN